MPAKSWLKEAESGDWVVTAQGHPVAILVPTGAETLSSVRSLLRSVRALQAQAGLQRTAADNGTSQLSAADIEAEIAASRRA